MSLLAHRGLKDEPIVDLTRICRLHRQSSPNSRPTRSVPPPIQPLRRQPLGLPAVHLSERRRRWFDQPLDLVRQFVLGLLGERDVAGEFKVEVGVVRRRCFSSGL